MPIDILNAGVRASIISEIIGPENKLRKKENLVRQEIYQERLDQHIVDKLLQEFTQKTVREMRKITSINLCKRIVDELASIYKNAPNRTFNESSDLEKKQLENLYEAANINVKFKRANKWFKLHKQTLLKIIPKNGIIDVQSLAPHQYDVIPSESDPELPGIVILNVMDRSEYLRFDNQDLNNQKIGDIDDHRKQLSRYIWWSNEWHFETDGRGMLISEAIPNPIGMLPFVDVSEEKDFEYWVKHGQDIVTFTVEFSTLLSDIANIAKLQGYAQAVIAAEKIPDNFTVGPNKILFLPIDPNSQVQPKFEFVNPNPDLTASLELLETYLRLFLTSRGMDPRTVSGKAGTSGFSSGIERLLSMIDKFEASKDDYDKFKWAESKLFEVMTKWSNALQGSDALKPELKLAIIPDKVFLTIQYSSPEIIQTKSEREDSSIKLVEAGLMSRIEAISELRGIEINEAELIAQKIDDEGLTIGQERRANANDQQGQPQAQDQSEGTIQ